MNDYQLRRKQSFDAAISRTGFRSVEPLTASFRIPGHLYSRLQIQVTEYLKISGGNQNSSDDLSKFLEQLQTTAKNLSTSGIVVPKSYCDQKFTEVHQTVADILQESEIANAVDFWIYPFNVRLKGAGHNSSSPNYPTELPHSETWVGCSLRSVLLHIPVLGDFSNNFLKVWMPGQEFDPAWLKPLNTYQEAQSIFAGSRELSVDNISGNLLMVDSSLLHGTFRNENAGPRVSIDLNVVFKTYEPEVFKDQESLVAERQKISNDQFFEIGRSLKVMSPDGEDDIFSPVDGMKHPAHIKLVKI